MSNNASSDTKNAKNSSLQSSAVTVVSCGIESAAIVVRHPKLDADGTTLSVVGCKSGIPGKIAGDTILIRSNDRNLFPATITHIHGLHDRFRAALELTRLKRKEAVSVTSLDTQGFQQGTATFVDPLHVVKKETNGE